MTARPRAQGLFFSRAMSRALVLILALGLSGWLASCCAQPPAPRPVPVEALARPLAPNLAALAVDPDPWMHQEANSEQRQPLYLGASPREMALGLAPADQGAALLPDFMKERGELQFTLLRQALLRTGRIGPADPVEFEVWPVRDDTGRLTWAAPRWRLSGQPETAWRWTPADLLRQESPDPAPLLPTVLDPSRPEEHFLIFADILELPGLYDKPAFGDCLWSEAGDSAALAPDAPAWLPTLRMPELRQAAPPAPLCRIVPQPVRVSGKPAAWRVTVSDSGPNTGVAWPADLAWKAFPTTLPALARTKVAVRRWPADFQKAYQRDVLTLDGEREAVFPISKRTARFTAKNNITPDNQLPLLVQYLEERYQTLGLTTFRQDFPWRGHAQTNLIAVIPGSDPVLSQKPVLMGDHIDTAFCEDVYAATGARVSAPGADDNVSATAALLRAAVILKEAKPQREIWLVHFTGEEFPADDLGARDFLARILGQKKDIAGLVLMDMIGWREKGDRVFQINPGQDPASLEMAALAMDAAHHLGAPGKSGLTPTLRPRFDDKSYLPTL